MHKSHRRPFMPREKQHRLSLAQSSKKKTPRRFQIGRLAIELAVSVKQRRNFTHIGGRGGHNLQNAFRNRHVHKETCLMRDVNCFPVLRLL